jgi:hypothetical protein
MGETPHLMMSDANIKGLLINKKRADHGTEVKTIQKCGLINQPAGFSQSTTHTYSSTS